MSLHDDLQGVLETEEKNTVSNAFGGPKTQGRTASFSVARVRDWLLAQDHADNSPVGNALVLAREKLGQPLLKFSVGNLIRFSFLIELTNLTVGSTKMKTRWLPGLILMPQPNSFEPIRGSFEPGNDPRSSSFETCLEVFVTCLRELVAQVENNPQIGNTLLQLAQNTSVPYEFVFDYTQPNLSPVHVSGNVKWSLNDDIRWLIKSRPLLFPELTQQQRNKIQTKTYKTDRALTGKDKTNRAKRWEVLYEDFQHASLEQCWTVERKLLTELLFFEGFPPKKVEDAIAQNLVEVQEVSRCPVTLEPLRFEVLQNPAVHGRADYQVGHLHPLKRNGEHEGANVCWQSSDGNRIQGDLTIEETIALLKTIRDREAATGESHEDYVEDHIATEN